MAEVSVKPGYYTIDGVDYPRVTNVLNIIDKSGLGQWRGRVGNTEANRVSKEAAQFGTDFHTVAADINRGAHLVRGWQPEARFREMAFAYIDWMHQNVEKIILVEKTAFSEANQYAGTLDLLAVLRGDSGATLMDIKTSNSVSMDWPLQLSAYKAALEEMEDLDTVITGRMIIRVPKKGVCEVEEYNYPDHEEDHEAWLNTLKLWRWSQNDKVRKKRAVIPRLQT